MEDTSIGKFHHQLFNTDHQRADHWIPPTPGCTRLDVDASIISYNKAACGGIIRDERGKWIMGFQKNLGFYPTTIAEILAIKTGLEVCQHLRLKQVQIFSNSLEAISTLLRDSGENHPYGQIIEETRQLLYEDWEVKLTHANRETLECADKLARQAHSEEVQLKLLLQIVEYCRHVIYKDAQSIEDFGPTS
ncbi:uncharacterized protein LOC114728836 [Neltuma alba]|uniref:uncharacterized protein LOC114728836 n=1 Tax=Neltuma alba TaxID=207710 RepID=UPI0010A4E367|nr:uncharacterized protein LOC114728836 [Prosopis alba]